MIILDWQARGVLYLHTSFFFSMDLPDLAIGFSLDDAINLVLDYAWLAEFRIVDFLTSAYWEHPDSQVPSSWRTFVASSLKDSDYAHILMKLTDASWIMDPKCADEYSCELKNFIKRCYELSFVLSSLKAHHQKQETAKRRNVKMKKTYEVIHIPIFKHFMYRLKLLLKN